jgi:hypothetical protein
MTLLRSKIIVVVLCFLPLIPIWYFDYLPLQDYPNHFARLTILSDYEHSDFYRQNFSVNYFQSISPLPYLALDIFVTKLLPFLDIETAVRAFISLYIISYIVSLYFLAGQLKLDFNVLMLVNLPLLYSSFFHFGFLNFVFSIPLFFMAIWSLERYVISKNTLYVFLVGLFSLLMYLSLLFTIFIFFVFLFFHLFARKLNIKEYLYILAAISLSLILSINYVILSTNYSPFSMVKYKTISKPFYYKIILLTIPFSYLNFKFISIFSLMFAVAIYIIMRNSSFRNKRYLVFSAILIFVYFALPLKAIGENNIDAYYLDIRFYLFALLMLPLSLQVKNNRNIDVARVILYGLCLVSFWGLFNSFSDFNGNFSVACASKIEQESTVFPITASPAKSGIRPYTSAWGYFYKEKEILTPYLFQGPHIPIQYKNRPPLLSRLWANKGNKEKEKELLSELTENYDYILLIGNSYENEEMIRSISHEICADKMVKLYKIEKNIRQDGI